MNDGAAATEGSEQQDPLRERLPIYARLFGIGLAAAVGIGLAVGAFTAAGVWPAIAYTLVAVAVLLLMAGGASGGGYTNLGAGAFSNMFGGRREIEGVDDLDLVKNRKTSLNLEDRLARGLRPGPNPQAFWQVVAGFLYLAIAVVIFLVM